MIKVLVTLALILTAWSLTACNTVQGVGRDIEAAGEVIQDAAE
jgi:entericidin B